MFFGKISGKQTTDDNMANPAYVDFLDSIVKGIVDNPQEVKVEKTVDEMGVLLTLHINPEDMGYVIGRKGQNARAIRTLLRLVGAKANARVNLKIDEPEGGQRPSPRSRAPRQEVDTSDIDDLKI